MFAWIESVFGDAALVYAFQALLLALLCFAELRERGWFAKRTGAYASVERGQTSWDILNLCFSIFSVNVLQIINGADETVKFKVLWSAIDLGVMIRLFFFNSWFRNKTIGLAGRSRGMEEGRRAIPEPSASKPRQSVGHSDLGD